MISCIVSLMNRTDRLEKILPSWTKVNKIKDFVVVDWSSKEPIINSKIIQEQIKQYPNIKIVRVENQKYFYRCLAWNLANKYTKPENKILLKLDVDYLNIDHSWMDCLALENEELMNYFITGCSNFYEYSTGFLLINKKDFGKGYNENALPIWGFEDTDLKNNLEKKICEPTNKYVDWENKLQRIVFFDIKKYIYHIPHSDKERIENLMYDKIDSKLKEMPHFNNLTYDDLIRIKNKRADRYLWNISALNQFIFEHNTDWTPKEYTELENTDNYVRVELR